MYAKTYIKRVSGFASDIICDEEGPLLVKSISSFLLINITTDIRIADSKRRFLS